MADDWKEHWDAWKEDANDAGYLPASSVEVERLCEVYRAGYSDGSHFTGSSKTLEKLAEIEAMIADTKERRALSEILDLAKANRDGVNSRLYSGRFHRIVEIAEKALNG